MKMNYDGKVIDLELIEDGWVDSMSIDCLRPPRTTFVQYANDQEGNKYKITWLMIAEYDRTTEEFEETWADEIEEAEELGEDILQYLANQSHIPDEIEYLFDWDNPYFIEEAEDE